LLTQEAHGAPATRMLLVAGAPLALGGVLVLLALFPVGTLPYPPCPIHALTGLVCPGCGTTRALSALAAGDLATSLRQNPAALLAGGYLTWAWLRLLARSGPLRRFAWPEALRRPPRARPRAILALLGAVLVWTVLRNLFPALAPL
jgi:hypothetical protein